MRRAATYSAPCDIEPRYTHRVTHSLSTGEKTEPRMGVIARLIIKITKPFKKDQPAEAAEREAPYPLTLPLIPVVPSEVLASRPPSPRVRRVLDAPYTLADHPFIKSHPGKLHEPRASISSSIGIPR